MNIKKRVFSLCMAFVISIGCILGSIPYFNFIDVKATTAERMISIATQEYNLGISGQDNKYTRWNGSIGGSYSYAWCATFISWCANQAGLGTNIIPKSASVQTHLDFARNNGRFISKSESPQPGDLAIFKNGHSLFPSHIHLVVSVNGNSITTIGGNESNKILKQSWKWNQGSYYSALTGWFRPNYSGALPTPTTCTCSESYAGQYTTKGVTTNLNMRSGHGSSYSIVTTIPAGATVTVSKANGSWAHVSYNGHSGYCSMDYLERINTESSMSISGQSIPTGSLQQGKFFAINGMISSNLDITKVWGGVYIRGGAATAQYAEATPNAKSYNLATYFDNKIVFNGLDVGFYTYMIQATDTSGKTYTLVNSDFQIGDPTPPVWYEGMTPVDLGTNFYAFIINTNHWKPLTRTDDNNVVLSTETGENNQVWKFVRQSDGSYTILNGKGYEYNMALDSTGSNETGSNVYTYTSCYNEPQSWYIYGESGAYYFRSKCTDCVIDVYGNCSDDGTNIQMYAYNPETSAQKFQVWKLETPSASTLEVNAKSSADKTVFNWNSTDNTWWYDLKIWNGELWNGDAYHVQWGITDTSCLLDLPVGTYQAYVESRNKYSTQMSNVVTFTVGEPAQSTVIFNPNGGMTTTSSKAVTYGSKYGILPTPVQTGYTFRGWYTDSTGGTKITADTVVSITKDQTLYAQWTKLIGDINQYVKGDANCDGIVTIADAIAAATVAANPSIFSLTEQGIMNADIHLTGDGISANDASIIQELALSIE